MSVPRAWLVLLAAAMLLAPTGLVAAQGGGNGSGPPDDGGDGSQEDGNATSEDPDRRQGKGDQARQRGGPPPIDPGPISLGEVHLVWTGSSIEDLRLGNTTLIDNLTAPALEEATAREQGPRGLSISGPDGTLRLKGGDRLSLNLDTDGSAVVHLDGAIDTAWDKDRLILRSDGLIASARADDLGLDGHRLLAAGGLLLTAGTQQNQGPPTWAADKAAERAGSAEPTEPADRLPIQVDGRYLSLNLTADGLSAITIHGVLLGQVNTSLENLTRLTERGARFEAGTDEVTITGLDAPRTQLLITGPNLTADLSTRASLPSGATVETEVLPGSISLRVQPPKGTLDTSPTPALDHPPVQRHPGPDPGLAAQSERANLGVAADRQGNVSTTFQGEIDGAHGEVGLSLDLVRAMLVRDLDGDGQVSIGEPALAEAPLDAGDTTVLDREMHTRFALWSGNLTVITEPGSTHAKITYVVEDLDAPPGTLFVLETSAHGLGDAPLRATPDGVMVENGSLAAQYSASGPVTVDDEDAWAQHSVLIGPQGDVTVLLTYPAGDEIVHDPTISVQSLGDVAATVTEAAPMAVILGAAAALGLVAFSVHRRRGPR